MDKIICNVCGKVCPSKKSYAGHMRLAHGIIVGEKQELKNKIKELTDKYTYLQNQYDRLKQNYEAVVLEYNNLKQDYDNLKQDYDSKYKVDIE